MYGCFDTRVEWGAQMNAADGTYTPFRRVALVGAIANPNMGDEAILHENLRLIKRMFGENCIVYVFTKDASYTALHVQEQGVVPVDYLHRITKECHYDLGKICARHEELLAYEPGEGDDSDFEAIHDIMRSVDVLHIVGGGYLNGIWPDMLEEVHVLTLLAQRYGARVLATGIGVYPLNEHVADRVLDVVRACEVVDFRDGSMDELTKFIPNADLGDKVQMTTDDAVRFGMLAPNEWRPALPADIVHARNKRYAVICLHNDPAIVDAGAAKEIICKVDAAMRDGVVEHAYLLAFEPGERGVYAAVLEGVEDAAERFSVISLVNMDPYVAWYLIAHAYVNLGTRYHQAAFSLAAGVPVFSIAIDQYYIYKLGTIHQTFGSSSYALAEDFEVAQLDAFMQDLPRLSAELRAAAPEVDTRWHRKLQAMCEVYAGDDASSDVLFVRAASPAPAKVSVIIPIYNMQDYLRQCLDSVLAQNLDDIEIICVDDGSTDATAAILYGYAVRDGRVKVITQKNQGVSAARNAGLRMATGEFVYFVDPDDWLPSNAVLSTLYWAAKEHGVLASCGGFLEMTNGGTGAVNSNWVDSQAGYEIQREGFVSYRDFQFDYGWIRFLYDRTTLISNELWFEDRLFYEDPVWFAKTMHVIGSFYAVDVPVYCYRTGYKSLQISYEKTIDLVRGLKDVLLFAQEHGYERLWSLTYWRATHDYASIIALHVVEDHHDKRLDDALEELEQAVVAGGGDKHTVRTILNTSFNARIAAEREAGRAAVRAAERAVAEQSAAAERRGFRAGLSEVRSSKTYKLGNVFAVLPRKVKESLPPDVRKRMRKTVNKLKRKH